MRVLGMFVLGTAIVTGALPRPLATPPGAQARAALDDIVGVWQSDTLGGTSARSTCAASPAASAVVCEQSIRSPAGVQTALNLFTVDSAGHFVFYNLSRVGDDMHPVRLTIANHVWIYGGVTRSDDRKFYRTVNDFSARASYSWRQESSTDGVHWVSGVHGRSLRIR